MKNIHVLQTYKPSRLFDDGIELYLGELKNRKGHPVTSYNIYITSDEEIKEGDWFIALVDGSYNIYKAFEVLMNIVKENKYLQRKIILTTDQELIKDGVQAIDDEFLEWFVKNPSCEWVKVEKQGTKIKHNQWGFTMKYFIKTPKEEPKQETLPELVNIIMMVSMDGKNWKRRNVIAVTNGTYITSNDIKTDANTDEEFRSIDYWRFAKPI